MERPTWLSPRAVSLRCTSSEPGFAAARYEWPVEAHRGKHVTLLAQVKLSDVKDNARIWIRTDREGQYGAAQNMMDERPLKGSSDWVTVTVGLTVPEDATVLVAGLLLYDNGTILAASPFIVVSGSKEAPANLSPPTTAPLHRRAQNHERRAGGRFANKWHVKKLVGASCGGCARRARGRVSGLYVR